MAFCTNCGAPLSPESQFCSSCGAKVAQHAPCAGTSAPAASPEEQDIQNNRAMGILSYIGLLVLVPIFAAKNSPFARFHANQGLVLLIVETAAYVTSVIFAALLGVISRMTSAIIGCILYIGIAVFAVIFIVKGIVSASKGRKDPIPIIGGITILK